MDIGTINSRWSAALAAGFLAAGVRRAVISPGSRSTPLALAFLRQPGLTCTVAVDERSAAFFALGLARAEGIPPLVLATSGTAVANWLPAVAEADAAALPVLFVSADRPPELHGCGANQTIPQSGMFTPFVRASHDPGAPAGDVDPSYGAALAARAFDQACWPLPGPVHLNQPFREPLLPSTEVSGPLSPALAAAPVVVSRPPPSLDPRSAADMAARISGGRGAIVCGELRPDPAFAEKVTALAAHLACPILAEPLSGLRFGSHDRSHLAVRYNRWLDDPAAREASRPDWVLRFGGWPVTRRLQDYVASAGTHLLVDPLPRWNDPSQSLACLLRADPADACAALLDARPTPGPASWAALFDKLEASVAVAGGSEHWLPALFSSLPPGQAVFVGNSLPIRQLDSFSGTAARPLRFFANRGASGIDGNVSTALGIATVTGSVVAIVGDLTCQHDIGGLALARGLNAAIIVVNNGGGRIFDHLPQAALPEFERAWRTPQDIDFAAAARTFGIAHARCEAIGELCSAVRAALQAGGPHLVELIEA
jgi:2-succinyl-5-enolpyruvyl-6-hydroxy-3-cyclohexene-1-carboxylate synthase